MANIGQQKWPPITNKKPIASDSEDNRRINRTETNDLRAAVSPVLH